jgi:hypothetical protein
MKTTWKRTMGVRFGTVIAIALTWLVAPHAARADLVAGYVEGYGGVSNADTGVSGSTASGLSPSLGAQAGVRLLGLELYGDYNSPGSGAIERGILGLRLGFWLTDMTRLELRVGGGAIAEQGGALTGRTVMPIDRAGVVGRVGVNLERRLTSTQWLMAGIGLNGEWFTVTNTQTALQSDGWIQGSDVLATLHLKFELGI